MTSVAFGLEHRNNVLGGTVAKQLTLVLFMISNAMALHQTEEILRRVARQRALAEVWILGQEIRRSGIEIGEVATTATGDADFFRQPAGMID